MLSQRSGAPNLGWTGDRHHHRHLATVNGDRNRVIGAGAGADGQGKAKVYSSSHNSGHSHSNNQHDHHDHHNHDQAPPRHKIVHKPSALRRPGSTTPRWTRRVLFNLGANTVNYTWHQDDYLRSEGALTEEEILMKQAQWQAEEDTEMLRQLHVRWNHFERSLPDGCKCKERLLYEESLRREQAQGYDIDSRYSMGQGLQSVGITDIQPNTPSIVTPPRSNPRRVVVAEMMSPVSPMQQHFNHNHNHNHAADEDEDDVISPHQERTGALYGLGHKRGGGGNSSSSTSNKRTSPILSPREAFQSPYAARSRPRRTASDIGQRRGRQNAQAAAAVSAAGGRRMAAAATTESISAPPKQQNLQQLRQPNTHTRKLQQQQQQPLQTKSGISPGRSAAVAAATTAAAAANSALMLQLEQARAEIKRKDQAIAARDSKLAEAWLKLERVADPEPAVVQPSSDAAAHVEVGKTKRKRFRWMSSLGWKSKHSTKASNDAAAAAAASSNALATLPSSDAAASVELEGDDGLTWDSTEMVRYGTPARAAADVDADADADADARFGGGGSAILYSGAIVGAGVGNGANMSLTRSEAARSFSPMENSRLSVIGPSTSIMQRAIDDAEELDEERKVREEQAIALVEKKAAARIAARVRRTAAAAPETSGGGGGSAFANHSSGSGSATTDIGMVSGLIRGGNAAVTTALPAATSAPALFGGASTRVAARPGVGIQTTKFVPTQQSKKEARKWAAEHRKVHKQNQKLQKKQEKESARWAKEQAQTQKRESKQRAKDAKYARSQHKKANAAGKALEAEAEAAATAVAATATAAAAVSDFDASRTGFSGTGVEDMWETDVAWKREVEFLQTEDPEMLQEELEARNASIHERSRSDSTRSRGSSMRGGGGPRTIAAAAMAASGAGAAVNRSVSMAAAPVARSKSKRFQWGLSFLRRSKSMRTSKAAPATATAVAVAAAVADLDTKPKRRWSIKPKFSFLRRKRTGNAAAIAARAAAAAESAGAAASLPLTIAQENYTAAATNTATTDGTATMSTDLDSLWLSLNPQADTTGREDITEI